MTTATALYRWRQLGQHLAFFLLVIYLLTPPAAEALENRVQTLLLSGQAPLITGPYRPIDLQAFVDLERAHYQKRITIVPPLNITFRGVLKTLPAKKPTGYLYTALNLMQVQPLPQVEYQVFIGAPGTPQQPGDVIAIYMDNRLAEAITALKESPIDSRATWYGYHIYNFSRGPAIVLENVALAPPSEHE